MPVEKRRQLARCYYEIVCYVPWVGHPDKTFLQDEVVRDLEQSDVEAGMRYSLKRCERYAEIYKQMWNEGKVAPPGSLWHRDMQAAYTLFLVNGHNSEVKLERASAEGRYNAMFEPAEDLEGSEVSIRPALYEEADDYDYPSADSYLLTDNLSEIGQQEIPALDEIAVAYPGQTEWRLVEEQVKQYKCKRFIAQPPDPKIAFEDLTQLQQKFVEIAVSGRHQVMYLLGKAGSGKTEVLLHICQRMKGRVQIGATTKRVHHGGNKVLRWNAANVTVEQNAAGDIKPSKRKSTDKIDGVVALIMALDRAMRHVGGGSVYTERGIIFVD
jgi:hypothetical protein